MHKILLIFPILSYLFLAAHELRVGNYWLLAAWLLLAVLILALRRPWVRHACAFSLMLGLFLWIRVTVELLLFRLAIDAPYALLLAIMGTVAGLILLSLALMFSKTVQQWFNAKQSGPVPKQLYCIFKQRT
ncbi:MAG: hypothetical protein ACQEQX_09355 [Thermodesulfobacteriota bacterium]